MNFPGGKEATHRTLINLIPPHSVYVEPFLGGGAVMRFKRPARLNIGIDIDDETLWSTALAVTPDPIVVDDDISGHLSLAGMFDRRAEKFAFIRGDCLDFLRWFPLPNDPDTFIYVDPPYLKSTRKSQSPMYRHEFWETEQHVDLLRLLAGLKCRVMISGYWSDLYADLLAGWGSYRYTAMTRGGGPAEEWLWVNYDGPNTLHDYRYLGRDYRERERIKRKQKRWLARFIKLDAQERAAMLWALDEAGILAGRVGELVSSELTGPTSVSSSLAVRSRDHIAGSGGAGHG